MTPLLSNLEYSLVMQAVHNAKYQHKAGEFIDPYAEEVPTDEEVTKALASAEQKIMDNYLQKI